VRVMAPPLDGLASEAVCRLLAGVLGARASRGRSCAATERARRWWRSKASTRRPRTRRSEQPRTTVEPVIPGPAKVDRWIPSARWQPTAEASFGDQQARGRRRWRGPWPPRAVARSSWALVAGVVRQESRPDRPLAAADGSFRGKPVPPVASARAAEAIVPEIEADDRCPERLPPGGFRRRGIEMSRLAPEHPR
jgi:hypothetical protein